MNDGRRFRVRPIGHEAPRNKSMANRCQGGLFLAADYCTPRWPATLEGAIRAGEAAAQAVAQSAGASLM